MFLTLDEGWTWRAGEDMAMTRGGEVEDRKRADRFVEGGVWNMFFVVV